MKDKIRSIIKVVDVILCLIGARVINTFCKDKMAAFVPFFEFPVVFLNRAGRIAGQDVWQLAGWQDKGDVLCPAMFIMTNKGPLIYVTKNFWEFYTTEEREAIVLHELGHVERFQSMDESKGLVIDVNEEIIADDHAANKGYAKAIYTVLRKSLWLVQQYPERVPASYIEQFSMRCERMRLRV